MCTQQLLLQSVCCANGKRELGVRKCAFRKKLAAALFCMIVFSREGKTVSQTMFVTGSVTSTEKFEWSVTSSDSLYTQTNTDSCSSDLHRVEHLLPRWKSLWVIDKSAGHVMWEEVVAASKNVHNQVHKFMNLIWFFLKVCVWKVGLLCWVQNMQQSSYESVTFSPQSFQNLQQSVLQQHWKENFSSICWCIKHIWVKLYNTAATKGVIPLLLYWISVHFIWNCEIILFRYKYLKVVH